VRIFLTVVAAVAVLFGSVTTPGLERTGQRRERGRAVGEDVEQSRSGAEPEATRPPVFFADGDLERCDAVLSRFERAWGGGQDAPVRAALLGIAEAGGWKGDEWQLRELKQGRDVSDQAWRWLALMAEVASTEDPILAGRIGLFFKVFSEDIGSKMKLADWFDYGLWSPSDAICTSALAHGINALGGVDPQIVVLRPVDVEPWDAATMRLVLCDGLLNRPDGDTPHESEARTIAASLLRQPPQMGPSRERRRRRVALPPDIIPRLESYGRVARNPELASEENYGLLEVELYQLAQADRDGLIEAVVEVARPAGGWANLRCLACYLECGRSRC